MELPSMTIITTWLLTDAFLITILSMGSVLHVEDSGAALCGAFAGIKSYWMGGQVTTTNLTSLSKGHRDKQSQQMKPTWNGFHLIVREFMTSTLLTICQLFINS